MLTDKSPKGVIWGFAITGSPTNEIIGSGAFMLLLASVTVFGGLIAVIIWSGRN